MRMLLSTFVAAVALATPALAQTPDGVAQGNQRTNDSYSYQRGVNPAPANESNRVREQRSTNSRYDVYSQRGEYIGSDPDPVVRNQLERDPSQGD
jgi:hypothetical protein